MCARGSQGKQHLLNLQTCRFPSKSNNVLVSQLGMSILYTHLQEKKVKNGVFGQRDFY